MPSKRKIDVLSSQRQICLLNVDETHARCYRKALQVAEKVNATETIPRVCKSQMYRDNIESRSPSEYFKRAVTIPFLDHILSEVNDRFSPKIARY